MRTQSVLLGVTALLLVLLLTGCGEVLNEYYLSNHTGTDLAVRLTPHFVETVDLSSGPLISDIQSGARSSLPQVTPFEQQGDILYFTLPAKTSIFLGSSSGGNDLFSHLVIDTATRQLTIDEGNIKQYFTVHDRFIGPVVHVLNIKE